MCVPDSFQCSQAIGHLSRYRNNHDLWIWMSMSSINQKEIELIEIDLK